MDFIKNSFGKRLAFFYIAAFIIVFIFFGLYLSSSLQQQALADLKESLHAKAKVLTVALNESFDPDTSLRKLQGRVAEYGKVAAARITLVDLNGLVLADSDRTWEELKRMDNHAGRPEIKAALESGAGSSIRYSHTLENRMLYHALPVTENGSVKGVLRIALPLTRVHALAEAIRRPIIFGSAIGIILVVLVGWVMGSRVSRQVGQMTVAARRFSRGDFSRNVHIDSTDELRVLGDSMNHMASSLRSRITEIQGEKAKASAIIGNMSEGVIAVDDTRRVLMVNPAIKDIFGVSAEAAVKKSLIEVTRNQKLDDMMEFAIQERSIITGEIDLSHGRHKVLSVNAVGVRPAEGEVGGIIVLHDISEIRRLENMRKDFVANVSHELRTPLTSVKGFIETLLGGAVNDKEKSRTFLKMMEEDTQRLTRLIDDVLTLSKIESQTVSVRREAFEIHEEIAGALDVLKQKIEKKKITVMDETAGKSLRVYADRDKVKQILINLLDNAVKFSEEGGRLTVRGRESAGKTQIEIEDNGPGISKDAVGRVFERFFRADKSRDREQGGTGLGLAIVKHLTEIQEGTVRCQSEPGRGSVFSFTLPTP